MRPSRKHGYTGGRPILLYTLPELLGAEDKMVAVDMFKLVECERESITKERIPCSNSDVFELVSILLEENHLEWPSNG